MRVLALGLALAWIAAPGCGRPQDGNTEDRGAAGATGGDDVAAAGEVAAAGPPVRGDTLVVGLRADPDGFDPVIARSSLTGDLLMQMFPMLAAPRFDCRLTFEPALATSWTLDEAGTALTLTLRDDQRWQDGEPVDVDDLLFTLERVADPAAGSPRGPLLRVLRDEQPWTRVDDHAAVLHLREPGPVDEALAALGATPLVPEHVLRDADGGGAVGEPFATAPVAAGPFVLERWERGQRAVLRRADHGPWAGRDPSQPPFLDRVELRVIPDDEARLLAFERGELDMVLGVELDQLARVAAARPDTQRLRRGRRFLDAIGWNQADPRLADPRVRTALALAADVDQLIAALLTVDGEPYAERATGTVTPEICGAVDPSLTPAPHDPARARELLADAGWSDADGDGVVERDGAPLRLAMLYAAGNTRREQAAVILQQQLAAVGVALEPTPVEQGALFAKLQARDFEAALFGWSASLVIDPTAMWHSGEEGRYNVVGFADPEVDRLIETGLAAREPDEAEAAWREMQRRIFDAQPYLFLYWVDEVVLVDDRFRGTQVSTVGVFDGLEGWWVPAAEQVYRAGGGS